MQPLRRPRPLSGSAGASRWPAGACNSVPRSDIARSRQVSVSTTTTGGAGKHRLVVPAGFGVLPAVGTAGSAHRGLANAAGTATAMMVLLTLLEVP